MVKRITYFIVAIIFFGGLFWLLSQPPKSNTEVKNQTDNTIPKTEDKYKDAQVQVNIYLIKLKQVR